MHSSFLFHFFYELTPGSIRSQILFRALDFSEKTLIESGITNKVTYSLCASSCQGLGLLATQVYEKLRELAEIVALWEMIR